MPREGCILLSRLARVQVSYADLELSPFESRIEAGLTRAVKGGFCIGMLLVGRL
jgi:hypothetical protein